MLASSLATLLAVASVASAASCPAGTLSGAQFNNKTYPATVAQIQSVIGDFQNSDWQGLVQVAKSGADNTANVSTRTVSYGPLQLVEELTSLESYGNGSTTMWNLTNGPLQLSAAPVINISSYFETLIVLAQCNGEAASIYWTVDFCYTSDNNTDFNSTIGGIFSGAHTIGLNNITTLLNIGEFSSCSTSNSTNPGTASASATSATSAATSGAHSTASGSVPTASASAGGSTSGAASLKGAATIVGGAALAFAGLLALI